MCSSLVNRYEFVRQLKNDQRNAGPVDRPDLALLVGDRPCAAAGVFTRNRAPAAPVLVSREHLMGGRARAVVINAGCANAATGERGLKHAWEMASFTAHAVGCPVSEVVVASTGVIGVHLPIHKVRAALPAAVAGLSTQVEAIRTEHGGTAVAITEPVPLYLTDAAGLVNATPDQFSEAIENETDVPAAVMDQTLALFADGKVAALVNNEQTTGRQTQAVVDAAAANGIPAVPVTETLPDGQDYLSWMQANIQALSEALGG